MKRLFAATVAVLTLAAMSHFTRADVPTPPTPKPAPQMPLADAALPPDHKNGAADLPQLSIIVDPALKTSTITLPAAAPAKAETPDSTPPTAFARTQTMVIGGALALSITCTGLWFFRGRNKNRGPITAALLLTIGVIGIAATTSLADIPGPGPRPHRPLPPIPAPVVPVSKSVTLVEGLEVTIEQGTGDKAIVRLTTADAAKLADALKANAAILPVADTGK